MVVSDVVATRSNVSFPENSMAKKLLVVTYYWPPAGGPGVQRCLKICRYLPEFGWQPTIITVEPRHYQVLDTSLQADVEQAWPVHRVASLEPFGFYWAMKGTQDSVPTQARNSSEPSYLFRWVRANVFFPDPRRGWVRPAVAKSRAVWDEFDAVLTTGPPHSTHLIGERLKKLFHVPWLADLRDPWTNFYNNRSLPYTALARWFNRYIESRVLGNADQVLTVSPGMKGFLPALARQPEVIFNGFDQADFARPTLASTNRDVFRITYTGRISPSQNTTSLWRALAGVIARDPAFARQHEINFVGNICFDAKEDLAKILSGANVRYVEPQPHLVAVGAMRASQLLLLLIPEDPSNSAILTGKIFEYLATGSSILGVGPLDGSAALVLKETGHGPMYDYEDQAGMEAMILACFRQWQRGEQPVFNQEVVARYSRQAQTQRLAKVIDGLVGA